MMFVRECERRFAKLLIIFTLLLIDMYCMYSIQNPASCTHTVYSVCTVYTVYMMLVCIFISFYGSLHSCTLTVYIQYRRVLYAVY